MSIQKSKKMVDKSVVIPINQDEISHYLKDLRKIKVMTPEREKELSLKIFYYTGNTYPYINQFKKIVSSLNDTKMITENNNEYSYISRIENNMYRLNLSYKNYYENFQFKKKMNVSKAILFAITRRYVNVIEDDYLETTLNKLDFNIMCLYQIQD